MYASILDSCVLQLEENCGSECIHEIWMFPCLFFFQIHMNCSSQSIGYAIHPYNNSCSCHLPFLLSMILIVLSHKEFHQKLDIKVTPGVYDFNLYCHLIRFHETSLSVTIITSKFSVLWLLDIGLESYFSLCCCRLLPISEGLQFSVLIKKILIKNQGQCRCNMNCRLTAFHMSSDFFMYPFLVAFCFYKPHAKHGFVTYEKN